MPWQGGVFGGKLVFEAGGKEYEMTRIFGRRLSEDIFDLVDTDTGLPSFDYSGKTGEELFHLDRESFLRTVFTAQQDCETQATDDVNALIGDLAGRAGDMGGYEDARKRLVEAANRLTPKRPTGTLYRRGERIAELARRMKQDQDAAPEEKLRRCFAQRAQMKDRIASLEVRLRKEQEELGQAEAAFEKASRKLEAAMSSLNDIPGGAALSVPSPHTEEPGGASHFASAQRLLPILILVLGTALLAAGIPVLLFAGRTPGTVFMAVGAVFAVMGAVMALSAGMKGMQKGAGKKGQKDRAVEGRENGAGRRLEDRLKEGEKDRAREGKTERTEEGEKAGSDDRAAVRSAAGIQEAHRQYLISLRILEKKKAETEEERHLILSARSGLDELEREIAELTELAEEKEEEAGLLRELREKQEADEAAYRHVIMAEAFLRKAKDSMTARYSDPIRRSFAYYWERITGYSAAGISVDADTNVSIQELGRRRTSLELSRGYSDLAGICLRAALADAMYPPGRGERPPLILDDPFTNLDDEKTRGALRFLDELGKKYQILYLTCSESRIGRTRL